MRRLMLLALLVLALPTAALANNITFDTGAPGIPSLASGTVTSPVVSGGSFDVTLNCPSSCVPFPGNIKADSVTLTIPSSILACGTFSCTFASGTVSVTAGTESFTDGLTLGHISGIASAGSLGITAQLVPFDSVTGGPVTITLSSSGSVITTGRATVTEIPSAPVPEPGALGLLGLGLLGNGVIGLVGMARRKLKLRT